MSYHNTTTSAAARQSTTNAQGKTAPAGYHYMPDGSLMSDTEHARLYGSKIIKSFNLDTSDIKETGERRRFTISGDKGATFSLEIKEGVNYYNFETGLFQTTQTKLTNVSIGGNSYKGSISFPKVAAGAQYDIYLFTENSTKHAEYNEVRFPNNSIDINSTTGSNSNLIQKVIYQTLNVTLTLAGYSPNGTVTGTMGTQVITTSRNASTASIPFSFIVTTGTSNTLAINKQPVSSDVMAFITATPAAIPLNIKGENIYPATTAADKVVNGAVEDGATNVTMDDDFTGLWAVGDRITGNAALDARRQANVVTVTAVNVGSNAKVFTMSEAIAIDDDETLSFSNRRNYRWSLDNIYNLSAGMRQLKGSFFAAQPTIKEYLTQTTVNEGEANEYKVDIVRIPALEPAGTATTPSTPVTTRDGTTKVETIAQTGNVTFSEQALLIFGSGSTNARIFSYGPSEINRLTGYDVEFTDLAVALTEITTTTTAASAGGSSTNVVIANRIGISDNISSVSGIGIDSSVANPTVASGAGSVTGAGTIVLSAAQSLESGITLTFPGAGSVATITGNIKVNKAGNENVVLRFDLEKFLTMQ
tara:strand:+ start:1668 stop:3434 length:1767 start_codon:yes stop_codon:yes gene_type:complete